MTEDRKIHKVSEEDFAMLNEAKKRKAGIDKDNIKYQQEVTLKNNELTITQHNREIDFKKVQLDRNEMLEKHESFKDDIKPPFYLENEIDALKLKIWDIETKNKYLMEEMKKEENVSKN